MKTMKEVIEEQRELIQNELIALLEYEHSSDDSDKLLSAACEMVSNRFDIILNHKCTDRRDREESGVRLRMGE